MKHDNSEFTSEIPDFDIPDFQSVRTDPEKPKSDTITRKWVIESIIKSRKAILGAVPGLIIDGIKAASVNQSKEITKLNSQITDLEATNAVLSGKIAALEEMVLELIDNATKEEE